MPGPIIISDPTSELQKRQLLLPSNFVPTSISGCKIWLRADSLALNDGDLVSTWTEEASGRNATAAGSARPTFKSNVLNGQNTVRFNGTANTMTLSGTFDSSVDTDVTIFIVYGNVAQTINTAAVISSGASTYLARIAEGSFGHIGGISSVVRGIAYNSAVINRYTYTASSLIDYQYGLRLYTSTGGATSSGFSGGNLILGSFASGSWWDGDIAEVIIYAGVLTSDQNKLVESYLASKYTANQSKIVCVGDSLTNGTGSTNQSYPGWLATNLGPMWNISRAALSGSSSSELLTTARRIDIRDAKSGSSDWLFVWMGTNDKGTLTAAQSYANVAAIAAYGRRCGYKTMIFTMLPRSTDSDDTFRTTFNGLIRTNAATIADAICDIGADATIGVKGAENNATYYFDGTHLTTVGYQIVANLALLSLAVTGRGPRVFGIAPTISGVDPTIAFNDGTYTSSLGTSSSDNSPITGVPNGWMYHNTSSGHGYQFYINGVLQLSIDPSLGTIYSTDVFPGSTNAKNLGLSSRKWLAIYGPLVGTTTNDNSTAGNVGEYVSALIAVGSPVSLTTATGANVTSISLTSGDWDVEGNVNFTETTATASARSAGITTTSATIPTDGSEAYCGVQSTLTSELNTIALTRKRISISGTTTVYLVGKATFSAGTVSGFGSLSARRVR